jgi:hypothetical protein
MSIPEGTQSAIASTTGGEGKGTTGRALLSVMIVFLLTYFVSRALAETWTASTPLRVLVALAPAIPLAMLLVMFARAVRSMDELHVRVNLEALAIAFPVTLLLLFVLGNLELVIPLNRDDWSYRHVWAMGSVVYFAALSFAWRRYR